MITQEQASKNIMIYDLVSNILLLILFICALLTPSKPWINVFCAVGILSVSLYLTNATIFIKSLLRESKFIDLYKVMGIGLSVLSQLCLVLFLIAYCYYNWSC